MVVDIDDLEVLTESGFKSFTGVKKSIKNCYYNIVFDDGSDIKCSYEHRLKKQDNNFVRAYAIAVGDVIDNKTVKTIELVNGEVEVYDLLNVEDTNSYITNNITSHNCAFVENWDEFFTSVFPTISAGNTSKIVLISTVNGLNHFYKTTSLARQGKNNYKLISVPWQRVPGRDEKWKQDTLAGMNFDHDRFAQEFENMYLGSSGTLIAGWKLQQLVPQVPIYETLNIKQYSKSEKERVYVGVADVSRGKGLDYSALQVIDVTEMPYKHVLTYRDNMTTPGDFAELIHRIGVQYNNCAMLVEVNDIGQQVAETLYFDFEYTNLLFSESAGKTGKRITQSYKSASQTDKGIRTTKTVKSIGCSMLKLLIEQDQLIINDPDTIQELSTFSKKNNTYQAESGCHDDLVMCLVLFGYLSEQPFFKQMTDINTLLHLKELNHEQLENELLPFGFVSDGHDSIDFSESGRDQWVVVDQNLIFNK